MSDTKKPVEFVDAAGVAHSVRGFGLQWGTDWDLKEEQAGQIRVLFSQTADGTDYSNPVAFGLDLNADQPEQQVIVAVISRPEHLLAAWDDLNRRIEKHGPKEAYFERLQTTDVLAIPNLAFNVKHEFAELQGTDKIIENDGELQGLFMAKAQQSIRFRLDKSGVAVVSESGLYPAPIPRRFVVDRPFLVVMKRRSANLPYFVAWIENTELLETPGR